MQQPVESGVSFHEKPIEISLGWSLMKGKKGPVVFHILYIRSQKLKLCQVADSKACSFKDCCEILFSWYIIILFCLEAYVARDVVHLMRGSINLHR